MSELTALPAVALAALLRDGEVSAQEVAASHLARLDALDPLVNAVVARDDRAVERRARWLDDTYVRTGPVGPLHGVPFTAKDWLDAIGLPCAGEGLDPLRRPAEDATAVARLRSVGGVLLAKTNVGVDHRHFGPCRNPIDPMRSAGASSSGEAAVVAWGGSALGLGSDSGGSIRLPAAWCGVVGLKPSHGLVPLTGHYPPIGAHHDGRTVIGPLARSVDDAWLALGVLAGPDGVDPGAVPVPLGDPDDVAVAGLRVAPLGTVGAEAAELLAAAGAQVVDPLADSVLAEAMDITQRYWHRTDLTGVEVDRWLWDWDRFRRRVLVAMAAVDVVVGPTVSEPAPLARPMRDDDYRWTIAWSLTGSPALSIPAGRSDAGLPLAVQVVGRPWQDHVVIAAGRALEAACADA